MVPFSERRHRLNELEVPETIEALKDRLQLLCKDRELLLSAEICFKAWYRLSQHIQGRPSYPEPITWQAIEDYIKNGTVLEAS